MTLLELLVFAHIAGAIGWVGGDTFIQLQGTRIVNRGTGAEIQSFVESIVYLTPRWFIPVSIWTVAFGIASAIEASFSFGDFWITAGLTMFVISFLIGLIYLGPQSERIKTIGESDGPDSAPYAANVKKLIFASRIELVLLWLTVFVMVVKPG
ncbi:MAG: hypothetical protein ACRDKE_04820 [Solirubrobacterales bacterium]